MAAEQYRGNYKASASATGAVYAGACRLVKLIVTTVGSAGSLTIKDGASGDTVYSAVGTLAAGTVVDLDIPMDVSIDVTAIGTSQVIEVVYSKGKN